MTIEEQLKHEILSKYKSVRAFTTTIDIPYSTLDSVFKRGISNAGVSTMIKVFNALDLDIESVRNGVLLPKGPGGGGEGDALRSVLIHNFDQLDQEGREKLADLSDDLVSSKKYIKSDPNKLGKAKDV